MNGASDPTAFESEFWSRHPVDAEARAFADEYKMNYPVLQMTPEVESAWGPSAYTAAHQRGNCETYW